MVITETSKETIVMELWFLVLVQEGFNEAAISVSRKDPSFNPAMEEEQYHIIISASSSSGYLVFRQKQISNLLLDKKH